MPKLLIRTNDSPIDEVDEMRQLLDAHHIDYYETEPGRWGFSVAGFWLRDEAQEQRAFALLEEYQQQRYELSRQQYQAQIESGSYDSFLRRLLRQPLRVLFYLLSIAGIVYLSLMPFLGLGTE